VERDPGLCLMEGRFAYTPCGFLDATHLRFFTIASIIGLFNDNGLEILDLRRIRKGFFDSEISVQLLDVPYNHPTTERCR
jgi:hypothetical protein